VDGLVATHGLDGLFQGDGVGGRSA
jgi:hypothetical protein